MDSGPEGHSESVAGERIATYRESNLISQLEGRFSS